MKRISVIITVLFAGILILPSSYAGQKPILVMGNYKALGVYSDSDKGSPLWGYDFSGSLAPTVKLNDSQHLIPLYSGSIKRMRQYIVQEEGTLLYNTSQLHNISVALRTRHDPEWVSRVTGIATWSLLKETRDEDFGKGLYDYRDFGAGFDLRQKLPIDETREHDYSWGIQYYRRTYPNFKSLISLATVTAPETDEKDFDGIKASFGVEEISASGISWELKPSALFKFFTDKKLMEDDGVLSESAKRRDYVISADLNGDLPLEKDRWVLSADNSLTYNHSNLDFYDSRGTLVLSDDVFTKDYYAYLSLFTYPYITYYHPLGKGRNFTVRGGYSFLYRHYPGRKVQELDGAYTDSKERDYEHALHLSTLFPISKELSWVSYFDYTWEKSNQKYERYYWYNYNVYQVQTGISVEF